MALIFEGNIELSTFPDNPDPKLVDQLSIIHEATDGELVQYYIDRTTSTEGDKNTYAIGVPVQDEYGNIDHYDYVNYPDVIWNAPKARITRQKIDRLGVKAFPGIGAIAFYKLAYRNLSQIVAPVNYNKARQKAPTLQAEISSDQYSVTFTVSNPIDPQTHEDTVTYIAFRICLVLDYHQLEYITYEKTLTVTNLPVSAKYLCYAIGYINEGEICSYESNSIELNLKGIYEQWPACSPGNTMGRPGRIACELLLSNWEEIEGHWEQTVIAPSIKDDDIFGEMYVEFTGSPQIDTLNNASLGCIAGAITSNGSITFYCYGNKPNANVTIYANRG